MTAKAGPIPAPAPAWVVAGPPGSGKTSPVLLSAPFTEQIHDAGRWRSWVEDLGGETVRLVWIRSDEPTLRHRLAARGSGRDAAKQADFGAFAVRMRLGAEPAAPHLTIDNRLAVAPTPTALEAQVAALID